jgi:hypothetical protein
VTFEVPHVFDAARGLTRQRLKGELMESIVKWSLLDIDRAKIEFADSAAEVSIGYGKSRRRT